MSILETKHLTKKFGSFTAVNDISFSMEEGEILGFLGPNGAGKTTTIQMLLGVLTPSSGEILYFGKNIKEHRTEILEKINFSSTYTNLPWSLSVKENLRFCSFLYEIKNRRQRVAEMLKVFKLEEIANQRVDELSAGQVTRLNLAKAMLNHPKVLLLDEPTASLDPDIASYIREFLQKERYQFNVSILITSHNMAEVEELCDRVLFINHGKVIADDTPDNLARSIEVCHIELLVTKNLAALKKYCERTGKNYRPTGKRMVVDVKEKEIADFLREISTLEVVYPEISIDKPSLEDYFLQAAKQKQ